MASKHIPLQVAVVSRSVADPDKGIRRRQIDLRSSGDRAWLSKHEYWCMMHGYSVALTPVASNDEA